MKQSIAKIEFINDKAGSVYAWTKEDGPYCLQLNEQQYKSLSDGQMVKVKYRKYGQYATLVEGG